MVNSILILTFIIILTVIVGGFLYGLHKLSGKYSNIKEENDMLKEKYNKVFHQKKSSEVRLGKIGENMAPFFKDWPFNPNNFRFIGSPIDGLSFQEDGVVFVEIKTGKSRTSPKQKQIKKLIEDGKVKFITFRVGEDKISIE